MNSNEIKARFDDVAKRLLIARVELQSLAPALSRPDDTEALKAIMTDLSWACENCTVIGLHQIDQALDDHMGT